MKKVLVVFLVLVFAVTIFAQDKNAELFDAVKDGDLATVQKLISKGADVNAKDNDGSTALKIAIDFGKSDVADFLRSKGAKE